MIKCTGELRTALSLFSLVILCMPFTVRWFNFGTFPKRGIFNSNFSSALDI